MPEIDHAPAGGPGRSAFKLAVFDMDGTLTDCVSSWQYFHERLGIWEEASVHQDRFRRGEITYGEFARLDAGHWAGIPHSRLEAIAGEVNFHPGAAECVRRLQEELGIRVGVISSGLTVMTDRARRELGADFTFANRLVVRDGTITGEVDVVVPIGGKGEVLERITGRLKLRSEEVVALGDSRDDMDLFHRAGLSIAVNPRDDALGEAADAVCDGGDFLAVFRVIHERMNGGS